MERATGVLTCNSCNKEFEDASEQKLHYKSDWHRYNLKRKVSSFTPLTIIIFIIYLPLPFFILFYCTLGFIIIS